jgi:hypothetical protein
MTAQKNTASQNQYVEAVVALYLQLPDTPLKPSSNDRNTASGFFAREIPMTIIEAALLLASLRRLSRNDDQPPLSPVRSLAYFNPVIQELYDAPLPDGYIQYLRQKICLLSSR